MTQLLPFAWDFVAKGRGWSGAKWVNGTGLIFTGGKSETVLWIGNESKLLKEFLVFRGLVVLCPALIHEAV